MIYNKNPINITLNLSKNNLQRLKLELLSVISRNFPYRGGTLTPITLKGVSVDPLKPRKQNYRRPVKASSKGLL